MVSEQAVEVLICGFSGMLAPDMPTICAGAG
jgi:hypothetical protein